MTTACFKFLATRKVLKMGVGLFGFRLAGCLGNGSENSDCGFLLAHICSVILNMRAFATPSDHDHLFAIAESQDGYFTMAQALEAWLGRSTHSYHVKEGNWLREHRGIYRLRQYPQTEHGHLVLWSLWSRDRQGEPQGVYSHTTALSLCDLSDANPSKLHMTVPPGFRRNGETPSVLVLHKSRMAPHEVIRERGYAITTAMRAILDSAASGDADMDMLQEAVGQGLRRGLITRTEIKQAKSRVDIDPELRRILNKF
jgi:predicted transcriptional regulator of viral defense system